MLSPSAHPPPRWPASSSRSRRRRSTPGRATRAWRWTRPPSPGRSAPGGVLGVRNLPRHALGGQDGRRLPRLPRGGGTRSGRSRCGTTGWRSTAAPRPRRASSFPRRTFRACTSPTASSGASAHCTAGAGASASPTGGCTPPTPSRRRCSPATAAGPSWGIRGRCRRTGDGARRLRRPALRTLARPGGDGAPHPPPRLRRPGGPSGYHAGVARLPCDDRADAEWLMRWTYTAPPASRPMFARFEPAQRNVALNPPWPRQSAGTWGCWR
jgi:hypothetical protein